MLPIMIAAKLGIKHCKFTGKCVFICVSMDVSIQLELCFYEQTQIVAIATCRVGS